MCAVKNIEEAVEILAKFLDDAMLAGHTKIMVIHGQGNRRFAQGRACLFETASWC